MASTIVAADLAVTITEAITLNNVDQGGSHTLTVSNVNEVSRRILTVPTSEVDVLGLSSANGQGDIDRAGFVYLRITNLDDTNFVRIRVNEDTGDTFDVKVEAGKSFMLTADKVEVNTTGAAFSAFVDIDQVSAMADTAAVDIEIFAAST